MKSRPQSQQWEVCCDILVALAVGICGGLTALVVKSLTTPLPPHAIRVDVIGEIAFMRFVLNLGLPLGILAFGVSTGIKIQTRRFNPVLAVLAVAALAGVSACALAMYGRLVAMHQGVDLWSGIWWRLGL